MMHRRLMLLGALALAAVRPALAQTHGAEVEREHATLRRLKQAIKEDKRRLKHARRSGNGQAAAAARAQLDRDEAAYREHRSRMRGEQWRDRRDRAEGAVGGLLPK